MYIIGDVASRVNNKCELFIKMCILIRGAGRETSQRVSSKLQKTPKKLHLLLTTPKKYDIITISLIIDFVLALHRFGTSFVHFVSKLHCGYGASAPLPLLNPFILRGCGCSGETSGSIIFCSNFKKLLTPVTECGIIGAFQKVIHRLSPRLCEVK